MRDHLRAFYSQLKSKVGNILAKAAALRIDLDRWRAYSFKLTHSPSHSQPSRLFSSSLPSVSPSPLHPVCIREGAGSQALSLLSDSIFWEHQSAYTVTMQLNTARSTAADIQNAQIIRTRHTYTRAGRRLKRESYLVIQRSRALPTKQATCPCTDVFLQHCLLSE